MKHITDLIVVAVLDSISAWQLQSEDDPIAAYGLIVDPDMTSMIGASASESYYQLAAPSVRASPVDWEFEYQTQSFQYASDALTQDPLDSYEDRATDLVASMVSALKSARHRHPLLRQARMMVVCADGGGVWDELEAQAGRQLNGE